MQDGSSHDAERDDHRKARERSRDAGRHERPVSQPEEANHHQRSGNDHSCYSPNPMRLSALAACCVHVHAALTTAIAPPLQSISVTGLERLLDVFSFCRADLWHTWQVALTRA